MKRPVVILISSLVIGVAIFAASYFAAQQTTLSCCAKPNDNLSWLQDEFHLSDVEMTQVRALHEGYLPKCEEMCAKIAAKKLEIESTGGGTNVTADVQAKLTQLAELRAQCQTQMIQHFVTVSEAMPPAQGQRYLAEMKRLTLDNHAQTEQAMNGAKIHEHQH
jgi:hypothetical protein